MRRRHDVPLDGAKALTHPLRIRIYWALEAGPASPSELARTLDAPLEAVSYHVRKLHQLGFIAADEPEVLEGNVRHTYRVVVRPWITGDAWEALRPQDRDAVACTLIDRAHSLARDAATRGGMRRPDAVFLRMPLELDDRGFGDVSAVLAEAAARIEDIASEAAARITTPGAQRRDGTFVAFFFETAPGQDDGG